MLLTIVAWFNLEIEQFDVKTAFLHSDIEEQVFIHHPEGFVI